MTVETLDQPESESEAPLSLDAQKAELAELYLSFLDSKKNDIVGTVSSLGGSINPLKDAAKDYLLAQDKKKGFLGKFAENVKNAVFTKVGKSAQIDLEYNRKDLDAMKDLLKQAGTTDQLNVLKKQIEEGKDPAAIVLDTPNTPSTPSSPDIPQSDVSSTTSTVETAAVVAGTIVLSEELQKVREDVEITGDLANIKKIKNADGKVILECTAETPFINVKALDDLLGFADAFFKKTNEPLTLNSAYRTIAHQEDLKKKNTVPTAAPGKSGHNLGLSIDIEKTDKKEKDLGGLQGFRDLAKQYHFNPISSEDWHFDHETLPKADERLAIAQSLDKEFQEERLAA